MIRQELLERDPISNMDKLLDPCMITALKEVKKNVCSMWWPPSWELTTVNADVAALISRMQYKAQYLVEDEQVPEGIRQKAMLLEKCCVQVRNMMLSSCNHAEVIAVESLFRRKGVNDNALKHVNIHNRK